MADDALLYSPKDACRVLGICMSKFYQLTRSGVIPIRKFGRRSLILHSDLARWAESLPIKPTSNRRPIIPRKSEHREAAAA
jgi:excisionase family DNA binding protein